ncbi:MAG: hypothetical protein KDA86_28135, partial [Planctomycetaceae bacterium]|nr:hypothetical protein [Planctomycetaceae bacterium]
MNPYFPIDSEQPKSIPWYRRYRVGLLVALVYITSYGVLSRRAFAHSDEWELKGMWFALPDNGENWRLT